MLTPEQWGRIDALFHEALEIPVERRSQWVEDHCFDDPEVAGELRSLLASDEFAHDHFLAQQLKETLVSFEETATRRVPKRVGPYCLARELGRGGMGTVYLAERDDQQYQTQVAVKLVRPGMDTDFILQRFRRERQILAQMRHPNIARLLDGGSTEDGLPYIVMEYIPGVTILEYCNGKGLRLEERIRLFLRVCDAVAHAHRLFVIHRDLKPGNILVDDAGEPKLLDFGICKLLSTSVLTGTETMAGEQLLTPDYASPEQVRGECIAITTDIYSLGAVLYELLTGAKPHRIEKCNPRALEIAICEQEIVRPSHAVNQRSQARALSGDIDTVLLRALEKDPKRRYQSVEQFSEDLRRYLEYLPVKARPVTVAYRVRKFWSRNRTLVVAIFCVFISLVAGVIASVHQARIASRRLADVRGLANKFVFDIHDSVRNLPGSTHARQLIVQTGLKYLDSLAHDAGRDWDLQKELAGAYLRIGNVQGDLSGANLGELQSALSSYRKSLDLLRSVGAHKAEDADVTLISIVVQRKIGQILSHTGAAGPALNTFGEAIRLGEGWLRNHPQDIRAQEEVADIYIVDGGLRRETGDSVTAEREASRAISLLKESARIHPEDRSLQLKLMTGYIAQATAQMMLSNLTGALEGFQKAAVVIDELVRSDPANTEYLREQLMMYGHIGDVLGYPELPNLGNLEGALRAYQSAVDAAEALHKADPADQHSLFDYAIALSRKAAVLPNGAHAEKLHVHRESMALLHQADAKTPHSTSLYIYLAFEGERVGDSLLALRMTSEAYKAYEEALGYSEALLDKGQASGVLLFLSTSRKLGKIAAETGDRQLAVAYAQRAAKIGDSQTGKETGGRKMIAPRAYAAAGFIYLALTSSPSRSPEDNQAAIKWLTKTVAAWRAAQSDSSFNAVHRREMQDAEAALAHLPRKTAE